jgi:hypothetical protein
VCNSGLLDATQRAGIGEVGPVAQTTPGAPQVGRRNSAAGNILAAPAKLGGLASQRFTICQYILTVKKFLAFSPKGDAHSMLPS